MSGVLNLTDNLTGSTGDELELLERELVERYQGHPKALELVAALIRDDDEFQGNLDKFLQDRDWLLTREIESFIDAEISRLSDLEKICLTRISVYEPSDYPLSFAAIQAQMPEVTVYDLKEKIIRALKRRHLLCYHQELNSFHLHPLFQEKAASLLNQNPENVRSAHRQAYRYFSRDLDFPETPLNLTSLEDQNLEYLKTILRSHYHASQAEDREIAEQLTSQFSQIWQSCPPQFQATLEDYLDKPRNRVSATIWGIKPRGEKETRFLSPHEKNPEIQEPTKKPGFYDNLGNKTEK